MALKINIDSIMKLQMSRKVIILVVINIFIIGFIYWFFTGPKREEAAQLRSDLTRLTAKLEENRKVASDIPKYLQEKEVMDKKLEAAVARLPNEKEIPDLIDAISNSAKKAGFNILLFKPGREIQRGFYSDIPINMSVEGRFESLYDFSVKVGNLPRIVNLTSIDISSEGHKNNVPILRSNFVATTFRFVPGPSKEGENK